MTVSFEAVARENQFAVTQCMYACIGPNLNNIY